MIYYLRCIESDYPQLIALGKLLGVIEQVGEVIRTVDPGDYWDYIGQIITDSKPRADKDGNVYIHVNLLTSINLRDAATAMAAKYPEVREGLATMGKYFLLDAEGNAIAPAQPHRVFAT